MNHEQEAKRAIPSAEWTPCRDGWGSSTGVVSFPRCDGSWYAYLAESPHGASAKTLTEALTNLRAKLTGDDLKRAFPDDRAEIRRKAEALQAFLGGVEPDKFGGRFADVTDDGCPAPVNFGGPFPFVLIRKNGSRFTFGCTRSGTVARAVIDEWLNPTPDEEPAEEPAPVPEDHWSKHYIVKDGKAYPRCIWFYDYPKPDPAPVRMTFDQEFGRTKRRPMPTPYHDPDPFGTRAAIAARKADPVPPELQEWQPGEWAVGVDDEDFRSWVNKEARAQAWERGSEFAVHCAGMDHYGATYAEAIANLRAAARRAIGGVPERTRVTYRVEPVRDSANWNALLIVGISPLEITTNATPELALDRLKRSPAWVALCRVGFDPQEEP